MELEKLLAPISPDQPCGPNREHEPDFMALEQASKGKPEHIMGESVVLAVDPDWADIKQQAEALFPLSKDLRVAILLLRANTRLDGLLGFSSGLKLIQEMLIRHWDDVHPCLDPDDNNDPTMRLNVLASLTDSELSVSDLPLINELRSVKFASVKHEQVQLHAQLSIRDILVTQGKLSALDDENEINQAEIETIVCADENKVLVQAMQDALQALDCIQALLKDKAGSNELVPDFKPLTEILKTVLPLCKKTAAPEEMQENDTDSGQQKPPASQTGEIRNREDVVRVLEKVCNFIERTEPTNPAPLLIRRAQYLMTKNFMEIVDELGPDWLKEVQRLSGGVGKK